MNAISIAPSNSASYRSGGQTLFGPSVNVPAAAAHAVSVEDICDLIDAAGPLTLRHIAGGLAVPARRVATRVRLMLAEGVLKQDEFGRYRLWGACATR